jgi:hypothetical protein
MSPAVTRAQDWLTPFRGVMILIGIGQGKLEHADVQRGKNKAKTSWAEK